jgi:transcriptional regulator with XRE-family HTH domain
VSMVERVKTLCQEKKTSIPRLEKELGFGRGAIYYWDTSTPGIDKVQKVANYFGVTIDSLVSTGKGETHESNP